MELLITILKSTDLFGVVLELEFEKKNRYQTPLGGLFSIAIFGLTIALAVTLGDTLIRRNIPRTNTSIIYQKFSPLMDINKADLRFGLGFYTRDAVTFDDPSYFTFEANKFILDRKSSQPVVTPKIELDYCKNFPDRFVGPDFNFTLDAKQAQMDNFYCLKENVGSSSGSFSTDYFENIQIKMSRCKNSTTSKVVCKTEQEINDKVQGGYFEFFYTNKFLDITDYYNPVKTYFEVYFITLDPYNSRFVDVFFKTVNITTDNGYVFEEKLNSTYLFFDYSREQFNIKSAETTLIQFYINSSRNFEQTTRSYMKLTEMLATIGGILNVCMVIGGIISKFFATYQMKIKMLNTLFFFDTDADPTSGKLNFKDLIANSDFRRETFLLAKIRRSLEKFERERNFAGAFPPSSSESLKHFSRVGFDFKSLDPDDETPTSRKKLNTESSSNKGELELVEVKDFSPKKQKTKFTSSSILKYPANFTEKSGNPKSNIYTKKQYNKETSKEHDSSSKYSRVKFLNEFPSQDDDKSRENLVNPKRNFNLKKEEAKSTFKSKIDFHSQNSDFKLGKIGENDQFSSEKGLGTVSIGGRTLKSSIRPKNFIIEEDFKSSEPSNKVKDQLKVKVFARIDNFHNSEGGNIPDGFFSVIGMSLCFCIQKFKRTSFMYNKGLEKLVPYMDYLEIIKTLQQFSKLKKTIFDGDQENIFEQSFKPRILLKDEEYEYELRKRQEARDLSNINNINYDDLYESYKELISKKQKTELDERLLEMFDDDLKEPFKLLLKNEKNR